MNKENFEKLSKLSLKDRIILNPGTHIYSINKEINPLEYVLNYIEEHKNKFDYIRYIDRSSKSDFYNTSFFDSESIVEEFGECKNMLVTLGGGIYVIPLYYFTFLSDEHIDNITDDKVNKIAGYYYKEFGITIRESIEDYKLNLERNHTFSEAACYEHVDDWKFRKDKDARIKYLQENNCQTYEDYNRLMLKGTRYEKQ
jgi:hypothetical protein